VSGFISYCDEMVIFDCVEMIFGEGEIVGETSVTPGSEFTSSH